MKKTTLLTLIALVAIVCTLTIACKKSSGGTPTPPPAGTKYFAAVNQIITTSCVTCHRTGGTPPDLSTDANIVANATRIKARAVDDATANYMPKGAARLSETDKSTINNWIAAGGKTTN